MNTQIKKNSKTVILFGAGDLGLLAYHALKKKDVNVDFFCDSNIKKQGKLYCGVKVISPEELSAMKHDSSVYVCNSQYIETVFLLLKKMNFHLIYDLVDLLKSANFSDLKLDQNTFSQLSIERQIALHEINSLKAKSQTSKKFIVTNVDIVITERCSLKCESCSNLMQYYHRPQNSDRDLLFKSVDKLMKCIDSLYEFRVLGGDPFMNKKMYEFVNKLASYKNVHQVVIYTNASILPKGQNFECLKQDKVRVQITNYGQLSYKHDELVKLCEENNIPCVTERVKKWQDVGTIRYEKKSNLELENLFKNCCANNLLTFLHGKLFRCPTAAHGTNLKAIPDDFKNTVDLGDETIGIEETKKKLIDFYYNTKFISACSYCKGRDYGFGDIDAAIQTKRPLTLSKTN